jgi:hypothetical protein
MRTSPNPVLEAPALPPLRGDEIERPKARVEEPG